MPICPECNKEVDHVMPRKKVCRSCNRVRIEYGPRARNKLLWKDWAGGKCVKCGYDKCLAALDFHHEDPNEKEFHPSKLCKINPFTTRPDANLQRTLDELSKCILLCANCHRELHYELSPYK